jgi:hypothetical protein
MRTGPTLTTLDRIAIGMIVLVGVGIGLQIGSGWPCGCGVARDYRPPSSVLLMIPGLIVLDAIGTCGNTGAIIACGLLNGAAYGVTVYGFGRLADAVAKDLPIAIQGLGRILCQYRGH